jgi:hypothetical protein
MAEISAIVAVGLTVNLARISPSSVICRSTHSAEGVLEDKGTFGWRYIVTLRIESNDSAPKSEGHSLRAVRSSKLRKDVLQVHLCGAYS